MNHKSVLRFEAVFLTVVALVAEPLPLHSQNLEEARATIPILLLPPQVHQAGAVPQEPSESQAESRGDGLLARRQYQAAVTAYEQAPLDSASVWNKMGISYEMLYDNTAAKRCYEKALQLDSKNAAAINNLGSLEMADKNYKKAEKNYRHAIKLQPSSALFHKNLGTAYISARRYKNGWEEYRAALAIDPQIFSTEVGMRLENPTSEQDRGAMNYFMAKGCLMAGEKTQAIEYLRLALNEGFTSPKKLVEDNEFAALRAMPAFQELIESETQNHPQSER
jgi:tetratricopeptide (TPR) repeat protein